MKQMQKISLIWGSILVGLLVLLTIIGFLIKDKNLKYQKLEQEISDATAKYVEAYKGYPKGDEKLKITLDDLLDKDIISKDELTKNNCTNAYTLVYLKNMVYHYDTYLKCTEYETENYQ